jgi:RNase adaptor protein for sRNA GlmZ degradation
MMIKIISFLILLLGMPTLVVAVDINCTADQETLKQRVKEMELKIQVLELEANKAQQVTQYQPQSHLHPTHQLQNVAPSTTPQLSTNSSYMRGPRGGCYTFSSSGRKRYVDRSICN